MFAHFTGYFPKCLEKLVSKLSATSRNAVARLKKTSNRITHKKQRCHFGKQQALDSKASAGTSELNTDVYWLMVARLYIAQHFEMA